MHGVGWGESGSICEHETDGEKKNRKPEESGSALLALLERKEDNGFSLMAR